MEYTQEQLNYFRICGIIVKLVPAGLRKIFKREWDFLYSTTPYGTWQDTSKNGSDFYLQETKIKRPAMNARYLNIMRNGNTAEWDCTCLFAAILYSNSVGATLSPTGKNNVNDLRQVRNDIAHITEDALTDAQSQSYTARVLNAFTSLGLPTKEIDDIKKQTDFPTAEVNDLKQQIGDIQTELDQTKSDLQTAKNELQSAQDDLSPEKGKNDVLTQEINSKVQSFCSLAFTPPHEIITRSSDIAKISKRMQELHDKSNGTVSTIYLSGNPGCGKSQLARQIGEEFYSARSRDTESLVFVATLNAETLESLADSYITLARKLGITEYSITEYAITELEKSKRKEPEETLKHAICMVSKKIALFSNWLIIADNVISLPLVRSYLPQTASKEWGHGQVLITTQDSNTIPSNAPYTHHQSLQKGMQPEDALELLNQVSQCSIQEQAAEVAEVLEYQPLALAAAAFYVQTMVSSGSPNYSWTEYLDALRKGKPEATKKLLADQSVAYSQTMTAAVKMAIERAMETSDVIREAFSFLSLCASESITVEAVVRFVKARLGSDVLEESIRSAILRSSLIVSEEVEDGAPKYLRLHNIVDNVLKTLSLFDSDSTQKLKHRCIATAIIIFESKLKNYLSIAIAGYGHRHLKRLSSHSKALSRIAFPECDNTTALPEHLTGTFISPEKVVSWLKFTAKACLTVSDIQQAKALSKLACDLLQYLSIGAEGDLLRSEVFDTRGSVLSEVCDFSSALSYHQEALDVREKLCFEENSDLPNNYVYGDIEQYIQSMEFHGKAPNVGIKLFSDIAESYFNLGDVYRKNGQHDQAKKFLEKALNIRIKLYGEEHGDVAQTYNKLGIVCSHIGQNHQAKEYDDKALNIRIKLYGEEHGDVAKSYTNLSVDCSIIGQHDQAKEFDEKALNIRIKLYGEQHVDVARSYNNLGDDCRKIGQHDQAKEFYEKALHIQIKLYGEDHGDVARSYTNLGVVCSDIGQHGKDKKFHERALNIRIKLYGEEHGDVAQSYNYLGVVCSDLGQHDQAKEFYEKALHIQIKLYGEDHGSVAKSYNNLGCVCSDIGQLDQAKEFYEKALHIQIKLYGEQHGDVANIYFNLGIIYRKIGQPNQAKEFHVKALNIRVKLYGEEHGKVADSYFALGKVYSDFGKHDTAREFFGKAKTIRRKIGTEKGHLSSSCSVM